MAEYEDREHFIPLRKSDLVQVLCADKGLPVTEREPFRQFCRLVSSVFHFEYLQQLEDLKDAYAPFDPDADTRPLNPLLPEERAKYEEALFSKFTGLMERANFKRLGLANIQKAMQELTSEAGLATYVELGMFERLDIFMRGDVVGRRKKRNWWKFGRKEEYVIPMYQRLVLIAKMRPHRHLDKDVDPNRVYLKIFKDIPKMDQDMLLPGARVRLSRLDRALIIYPLVTGIGLLLYNIVANVWGRGTAALFGAAGALASWSVAAAVGGYGYKSYHSYQVKKQNYSLKLTKSLYYKSLDNNSGVLHRLLDEAEEQECRETFLAYFCLLKYAPPQGWTPEQLDDYVEMYLEEKVKLKVDFEIGDALAKLERLKIVEKVGGHYKAQPLDKALEMLDWTWDNYFKYNNPEIEEPPLK